MKKATLSPLVDFSNELAMHGIKSHVHKIRLKIHACISIEDKKEEMSAGRRNKLNWGQKFIVYYLLQIFCSKCFLNQKR